MVAYIAAVLVVIMATLATPAPAASPPPVKAPQRAALLKKRVGHASWYGAPFHGRRTTSGERYDMHGMTAASPDLPLGTRVAVTNLTNGRRVEVRVNDRMPPTPGRMIDLSHGAAARLRAVEAGVIPVRVVVLSLPEDAGAG
jgi:peptidoglycan lytic transglycosylase